MELQAFEVQVFAKIETRGLKMPFVVKISSTIVFTISELFQGEPNEILNRFSI